MLVSVVIPTVDRVELLAQAVRHVFAQELQSHSAEIIVVDNSPTGRQCASLNLQSSTPNLTLRCVHEPNSGLAHARNRGIREANGEYVVFLDDDEYPPPSTWLIHLVNALVTTGADAAFGPVVPEFESRPEQLVGFVQSLYSRDLKEKSLADVTRFPNKLGTGNSCFRARTCFQPQRPPFNEVLNHTGGEDVDFLIRLQHAGKRFVWEPKAYVHEIVPAERLLPAYLSERRFRQGQQRSYLHISSRPRRYDRLVFWMLAGALQTTYRAAMIQIARIRGDTEAVRLHRIQFQGGLGKMFWQERYRQQSYGTMIDR